MQKKNRTVKAVGPERTYGRTDGLTNVREWIYRFPFGQVRGTKKLESCWCGFLRSIVKGGFRRKPADGNDINFSLVYTNHDIYRISKCHPIKNSINTQYNNKIMKIIIILTMAISITIIIRRKRRRRRRRRRRTKKKEEERRKKKKEEEE